LEDNHDYLDHIYGSSNKRSRQQIWTDLKKHYMNMDSRNTPLVLGELQNSLINNSQDTANAFLGSRKNQHLPAMRSVRSLLSNQSQISVQNNFGISQIE